MNFKSFTYFKYYVLYFDYQEVFRGEHKITKKQIAVKKLKPGFSPKIVDDEAEFMMQIDLLSFSL